MYFDILIQIINELFLYLLKFDMIRIGRDKITRITSVSVPYC